MSGNVSEWVADWWDENYYKNSPKKNPKGPNTPTLQDARVIRDGPFDAEAYYACTTGRGRGEKTFGSFENGFRCAK